MNRRAFFGALAGTAALAATAHTAERQVRGWRIEWSGWREPVNQHIRVGYWWAARSPMPATFQPPDWPCYYSTTMGFVCGAHPLHLIDMVRYDPGAPVVIGDDPRRFEAAKAWARQRLIEKLESL